MPARNFAAPTGTPILAAGAGHVIEAGVFGAPSYVIDGEIFWGQTLLAGADARTAHVFVGVQIQRRQDVTGMLKDLADSGLQALDLTDNELAKLHIRHLVGGLAPLVKNELLYRFEFPEKPGALMNFLNAMSAGWNISLFHYRNHGADYGRVLVGMQVPPSDRAAFTSFLDQLGYPYWDESNNPAYKLFLG